MLTIQKYNINFKSNHEREAELRELARILEIQRIEEERRMIEYERRYAEEVARKKAEEAKRRAEIERKEAEEMKKITSPVDSITQYPKIDNDISKITAAFFSQFTCAIRNNSEHDVREFFADDKTAEELRRKLSTECQQDSLALRNELKKLDELNDPIMMLMSANRMKNFAPKPGLLTEEQQTKFVEDIKDNILNIIRNQDLSKFTEDEQSDIVEIMQMIKGAKSVDFGISVKLKALVDKINKRKLNVGFIAPVEVKNLKVITKTIKA